MAENLVMGRRTFIKGSLAASALAALAACGKNEGSGATKVMKYYINEPVSIDPYNLQESEGTAVGHLLFRSLYSWDWDKGEAVPCAAKYVKISDDGKVYTFELVDAKFHNGDKVDAESFKRGWQRLADPTMATPGDIGYHLAPVAGYDEFVAKKAKEISGLVAVDDTHFEVTLTAPMADFLAVCCHPGLAPVPQAAIDDPDAFLLAPIGNGPFMMDGKWESGKHINLKRFEDYFGEAPKIDAVNFSIQKDPKTAYSEFEAGNMDFCMVPTGQLSEAKKKYGESEDGYTITPGKQVITGAEASVYYLIPNLENKVMANKDLRHAISLAIDRQNAHLEPVLDTHHPAVLKEIKMAVDAAHRHGIWCGICGELGADLDLTETFLRMGIDELSVNPKSVLPLRKQVRGIDLSLPEAEQSEDFR